MVFDIFLSLVALWFAFVLRLEEFVSITGRPLYAVPVAAVFVALAFSRSGIYNLVFRYAGRTAAVLLLRSWLVYAVSFFVVVGLITLPDVPRSIGILQPLLFLMLAAGSRYLIRGFIAIRNQRLNASGQLTASLVAHTQDLEKLASLAIDISNIKITGLYTADKPPTEKVLGFTVMSIDELDSEDDVSNNHQICIPDSAWGRPVFDELLSRFDALPLSTVRRITDRYQTSVLASAVADDLDLNMLLGRPEANIDESLLKGHLEGKVVLISGAAGTIGSELVRQCLYFGASRVVALDHSEYGLYALSESMAENRDRLEVKLCDCKQIGDLGVACRDMKVDIVLHAAAYKHVPLVEANPQISLRNNLLATANMLAISEVTGASAFTLISSDKAVRPTNLMGASKRLSELLCEAYIRDRSSLSSLLVVKSDRCRPLARVNAVRFGNVIGSSGSVLVKFKSQVLSGRPVTVTHPDVTRYFMTVHEAVSLVLASGTIAPSGHSLYHLDMGPPIKIADLARRVIFALGAHYDPEKSIVFTGLRPGEKLFEELLISGDARATSFGKVMQIDEVPRDIDVRTILDFTSSSANFRDVNELRAQVAPLVDLQDFDRG